MIVPTERRVYPATPDRDLVEAFRRHVRETGQPETFPTISTTSPPADSEGALIVLAERIPINVKLRPLRDYAPCPLCSGVKPKWKHGGTLIWCEATSAIYCIGPDCSTKAFRDRLNIARNIFRRDQKAIDDALQFESLIAGIPALVEWIDHHIPQARDLTGRHKMLRKELPEGRGRLSRSIRSGMLLDYQGPNETVVGHVSGGEFLKGTWTVDRDLEALRMILSTLWQEASSKPAAWVDALAPTVRHQKLLQARKTVGKVRAAHSKFRAGSEFLAKANLERLAKWTAHGGGPYGMRIVIAGAKAEISFGEEFCRVPFNLPPPLPLPLPEGEYGIQRIKVTGDIAA